MQKQIVVTRHSADVSWLESCRGFDRTFLYDKGPAPLPGAIVLPNVGRDTHTHLHHLVTYYDALPDLLVLCQDQPFDHAPHFLDVINADSLAAMETENRQRFPDSRACAEGFLGVGAYRLISKDLIESDPTVKDDPEKVNFHLAKYRLIATIWAHVFPDRELPAVFPSTWGCQFVLSAARIRVNSRSLYEFLRDLHRTDPMTPYALENLWWFLFRCDTRGVLTEVGGEQPGNR